MGLGGGWRKTEWVQEGGGGGELRGIVSLFVLFSKEEDEMISFYRDSFPREKVWIILLMYYLF